MTMTMTMAASLPRKHAIATIFCVGLLSFPEEGCALSPSPGTRRDFLDGGVASVASAAAVPLASAAAVATPSRATEVGGSPSTSSRVLSLPPLGLGAWAW